LGLGESSGYPPDRIHALHVRKGKVRFYLNLEPMDFTPAIEKELKDLASRVAGQL
jgi:hypothetical protein